MNHEGELIMTTAGEFMFYIESGGEMLKVATSDLEVIKKRDKI